MHPVVRAFERLGVPLERRAAEAGASRGQDAADAFMVQVRAEALANFRRLVKAAHPDLGGSAAETQALLEAKVIVETARLRVAPPAPPPVVVRVFRHSTGGGTATVNNTNVRY